MRLDRQSGLGSSNAGYTFSNTLPPRAHPCSPPRGV